MRWSLLLALVSLVLAVDRSKFRTCSQTSFCSRNRQGTLIPQNFALQPHSVSTSDASATLTGLLQNSLHPTQDALKCSLQILADGTVHWEVDEQSSLYPRYRVRDVVMPNALVSASGVRWSKPDPSSWVASFRSSDNAAAELRITSEPFTISYVLDSEVVLIVNDQQLMQFEPHRAKPESPDDSTVRLFDFPLPQSSPHKLCSTLPSMALIMRHHGPRALAGSRTQSLEALRQSLRILRSLVPPLCMDCLSTHLRLLSNQLAV